MAVQAVVDVATLVASANEIEVDDGERLEAVLSKYSDVEDYRKALALFEAHGGVGNQNSVSVTISYLYCFLELNGPFSIPSSLF